MAVSIENVWATLREQAEKQAAIEPMLKSSYYSIVLQHDEFSQALAYQLSQKLASRFVGEQLLNQLFLDICAKKKNIEKYALFDLVAYVERDPACDSYLMPLLYFKGFMAIQAQRFAHQLWQEGRKSLAYHLQSQSSKTFDVDIHPAAQLGYGLMFDHATGIVIGETAEVGNNVSMLHAVTLGGSGVSTGKRHPSVREGVMISVGAKLLGAIEVGEGAKIGGGSVVLGSIPDGSTVVGVPAKVVGGSTVSKGGADLPAFSMDQYMRI